MRKTARRDCVLIPPRCETYAIPPRRSKACRLSACLSRASSPVQSSLLLRCLGATMEENSQGGEENVCRDKTTADDAKHEASRSEILFDKF